MIQIDLLKLLEVFRAEQVSHSSQSQSLEQQFSRFQDFINELGKIEGLNLNLSNPLTTTSGFDGTRLTAELTDDSSTTQSATIKIVFGVGNREAGSVPYYECRFAKEYIPDDNVRRKIHQVSHNLETFFQRVAVIIVAGNMAHPDAERITAGIQAVMSKFSQPQDLYDPPLPA